MKSIILGLALFATALQGQNTELRWAVAGQMADLVSTQIGLANGATEMNPLMQRQPIFISTKIGLSVSFYIYARRHPRDKRTMTIFAILSWLPVVNNLIMAMK